PPGHRGARTAPDRGGAAPPRRRRLRSFVGDGPTPRRAAGDAPPAGGCGSATRHRGRGPRLVPQPRGPARRPGRRCRRSPARAGTRVNSRRLGVAAVACAVLAVVLWWFARDIVTGAPPVID